MARVRYRNVDTQTANSRLLSPGHVLHDTEAHALRLHDGKTPGGLVINGKLPTGPGPRTLQAGDDTAGFYGEVPVDEVVDGETLASEVGLIQGNSQFLTEPWLKFAYMGKTLFIPRKTVRYGLSWENLYQAGLVYGVDGPGFKPSPVDLPVNQNTQITIDRHTYSVRLMTGGDADPASGPGGEWDALIQQVHESGQWSFYTNEDLHISVGNGKTTQCQETDINNNDLRVDRGWSGIVYYGTVSSTRVNNNRGWRPVLELVS